MNIEQLKDYLVTEAEYEEQDVEDMTPFELVDAYMSWQGVIGYTQDFIEAVEAAYGVEIS